MPIDLYSSLKGASQWAFGSPLLNNILGSSIFVAAMVSVLMILLIMFMYPAKAGTSGFVIAKMFIYMFFGALMVIFLHDGVMKHIFEEEYAEKESEDFMQNTTSQGRIADPAYADMYKPVSPIINPNTTTPGSSLSATSARNSLSANSSNSPGVSSANSIPPVQLAQTETDAILGGVEMNGKLRNKPNKTAHQNPFK